LHPAPAFVTIRFMSIAARAHRPGSRVTRPRIDRDKVLLLHREGRSTAEIAEVVGCSRGGVQHVLERDRGLRTPVTTAEVARIRELAAEGMSVRQIGLRVGRDWSTIRRYAPAARSDPPPPPRPQPATVEERHARVLELRNAGVVGTEIAPMVGVSVSLVYKVIERARNAGMQVAPPVRTRKAGAVRDDEPDAPADGILIARPVSVTVMCMHCGQRHALPVEMIGRSVIMPCGRGQLRVAV